jgi:hypothetical protein
MDVKWIFAIGLEASFWIMLAAFLVLRYRYEMESITRFFVVGVVLNTLGFLTLGVWDFAATGHVNVFTVFIVALVAYGISSGRKHFEHLDAWMARKIKPRAGTPSGSRATSRPCPDRP